MIFASKTPVEGEAIRQFEAVLALEGISAGAGFPDLHPGRGFPVGAAFVAQNIIYPHLVGNDIGCGMGLFKLNIKAHKFKIDKVFRKLADNPEEIIQKTAIELDDNKTPEAYRSALGTIGHGNHFIEFLAIDDAFNGSKKDDSVYLLIHCGSRGFGEMLWRKIAAAHGNNGLIANSADGIDYLTQSNYLIEWARYNRCLVANAIGTMIRGSVELVSDSTHNSISSLVNGKYIHRKGATEVIENSPVMVAGSRGTHSYLVQGIKFDENLSTLAHGCGRKWQRGEARSRIKDRYRKENLQKTAIGSWVICNDKNTLYEEAPEVYKNIDTIIADMEDFKLAKPLLRFKPLLNIKP